MRKIIIVLLLLSIGGVCLACAGGTEAESAYLRIHVRANSNSEQDQAVKYEVRDAVVAYLTPIVAECNSKGEAMEHVRAHLHGIEETAERVLLSHGDSYGAKASLRREEFPTRVYGKATLEAGVYDALILELGTGKGDNWWCVVYPPLCFTSGGGNVVYRSKIAEIIRRFFEE